MKSKTFLIKLAKWLPALFITACSCYLSSQPTIEHMPDFWNADKLVHLVCFGGLAFWVAFGVGTKLSAKWRIILPVLLTSAYGFIDEIHQSFTPGRSCSVWDWCADTLGALLGSLAFYAVCRLHRH